MCARSCAKSSQRTVDELGAHRHAAHWLRGGFPQSFLAASDEQSAAWRQPDEAYFWATHQGAEIDLLLRNGERIFGVECELVDAPTMTPSLRIALEDLKLESIAVVYPGPQRYRIAQHVEAVPLAASGCRFRESIRFPTSLLGWRSLP